MLKRAFDVTVSTVALLILFPVFVILSLVILFSSRGPVFYRQVRVGKNNTDFRIFKFRTMYTGSDKKGLITVGGRDSRITTAGYFLRKYKLDELPQLLNVIAGDMSLVGPRPEVRKYVLLYNTEQLRVLTVKPGITDYASIEYAYENELLGKAADPDQEYIKVIMPAKLDLNLKYIREQSLRTDLGILWKTLVRIVT